MSLGKSILPAFYDQCVYHEFAEKFLREKYGENVYVYNKRLPLFKMNTCNFEDYRYNFRLNGKTYQFLYYIGGSGSDVFYGDNVQYNEVCQLVDSAVYKNISNSTISDYGWIDWEFTNVILDPCFAVTMFTPKYTGDNLQEFPIRIIFYWDKKITFGRDQEILEEIYTSVTENLAQYDVACKEMNVCKYSKDHNKNYIITETSEGIKIGITKERREGSRMGKGIAKKIGKGFLWLTKLGFVLLCLLIWGALCVPLGESILPAFYDQCVYHEFAEKFLREKYGENVYVYNKRLPLFEMNSGNSEEYKYNFRLHGKIYQFIYIANRYYGDFYGDNVQYDEIYGLIDEAIKKILYNNTISDFDQYNWKFSEEVHPDSLCWWREITDTMLALKYTGDNLHEFPVRLILYWDKETAFDSDQGKLEEMYTSVTEDLALYDVDCREIHIFCTQTEDYYYITKTSEGIKIEERDYGNGVIEMSR